MVRIGLRENRTTYDPGDEISGAAIWELDRKPKSAEVHLLWYTRGKGTEDIQVVEEISFDDPQPGDTRTFSFRAPLEPYTFSGKLISLVWAVELVVEPGDDVVRMDIVIAPGGREVVLP